MQFNYDDVGCFGTCSPKQAIANGAHAVLVAKGDDTEARYHGRVTSPGIVIESEGLACMCHEDDENGGSSSSSIQPADDCYAPAVRRCSRTFALRADVAGPVALEVLDAKDAVVDRIVLVVADVARLEPVVKMVRPSGGTVRTATAAADGAFEIDPPSNIEFGATAVDARGNELRKRDGDVAFTSTDAVIRDASGHYAMQVRDVATLKVTATGLGTAASFVVRVTAPSAH